MALTQAEFNALVDDHGPALYRMAYRMMGDRHEAEDMVQEAFRSAWKSRQRFDSKYSRSESGGSGDSGTGESGRSKSGRGGRAWLVSILRRRVIDRWRKRPQPGVVSGDEPLDVGVDPHDPLANEYTDEMQHALGCLPRELRETLLLVVVAELTHQEAADLLQVPLGTVLSRVSRARQRLREYLLAAEGRRISDF